jgi:hypothetical protein
MLEFICRHAISMCSAPNCNKRVNRPKQVCLACQVYSHVDTYNGDEAVEAKNKAKGRVKAKRIRKRNLDKYGSTARPSQQVAKDRFYTNNKGTQVAKLVKVKQAIVKAKRKFGRDLTNVEEEAVKASVNPVDAPSVLSNAIQDPIWQPTKIISIQEELVSPSTTFLMIISIR